MKKEEFELIAQKIIREKYADTFDIMPEATKEFDSCFAVYFQTVKFITTRDRNSMAIGQGPIIISKKTKEVFFTGSGRPTTSYVESFERFGNPNLKEDKQYVTIGIKSNETGNKLKQINLLKTITGKGITEVNKLLSELKNGSTITTYNNLSPKIWESLIDNGFKISHPVV